MKYRIYKTLQKGGYFETDEKIGKAKGEQSIRKSHNRTGRLYV